MNLIGCWVNTHCYNTKTFIDKVIEFTEGNKVVIYSYYDRGKNIYPYTILESTDEYTTILVEDGLNIPNKLEFVSENEVKFQSTQDESSYVHLSRISEDDALPFIEIIEKNALY